MFIGVASVQYRFNLGHGIHLLENDILQSGARKNGAIGVWPRPYTYGSGRRGMPGTIPLWLLPYGYFLKFFE